MKKIILNYVREFTLVSFFFVAVGFFQAQAQNLVLNGDFEASTNLQNWDGFNNQELTDADTNSRVGNVNAGEGSLFQVFTVVPEETYDFSFDYKWVTNGQPNMNMIVRVRNEADNVSFEDIPLNSIEGSWDAANVSVTVPAGVTQVRILFFKANTNKPFRLDNVVFEPQVVLPCIPPTNVLNAAIASTSAYFSWDASPSEIDGYDWVVVNDGGDPDTALDIVGSGNVATGVVNVSVTGLTEATAYDFYVRTRCNSEESAWSTAVSFTPSFQENLIVNSRFTTNEINASFSSWEGFNQDTRIDNINGAFVGYIDNDGTLRQDVNVVPGVEYVISFNYRWLDTGRVNGNAITPTLRNPNVSGGAGNLQALVLVENDSNVWYTVHYTYTLPLSQNIGQLRLQFFKVNNTNQLHINNVTVLENIDISADADYVYKNGTWSPSNPAGVSTATDDVYIFNGNSEISSSLTANNLEVSAWADLDISSDVNLVGVLTTDGQVSFKSDDNTLGQIASGSVSGSVTVERYIPAKRAFRLLTSSVDSDESIFNNWQEKGVAPSNLGTHITGSDTGANGFDQTTTGNSSLFTFDNTVSNQSSGAAWSSVNNTDVNQLAAGTLYRLYVRGDRNIDLTNNQAIPDDTRIRARGTLRTGNQTTGVDLPALATGNGQFSAVANPYQAIVDASALTYTGDVNSNYIYVWDPQIAGNAGSGGYVIVDTSNGNPVTSPDLPIEYPNPSSSDANQFIMPGQAFFILNNEVVNTSPSIGFTEADKAPLEPQTQVFSENIEPYLNLRLYEEENWNNDEYESDALGIRWSPNYSTNVSGEDALKLGNPAENFAVQNGTKLVGIEKRNTPINEELIPLFINNYEHENYVIYNQYENLPEEAKLYLEDQYLETSILLSNEEVYAFSVDASIPESMAFNRFSIRYDPVTLSQTEFEQNNFNLYPNPVESSFFITVNNQSKLQAVEIYNQMGQLVMLMQQNLDRKFDVSQLQTGVYFVKVSTENESYTSKFIKN